MKVRKIILPILIIMCLLLTGCGKKETKSSNESDNIKSQSSNNSNVETKNKISSAKIDLYNGLKDSKYLTAVLYDPFKDRQQQPDKDDYDKVILVTYNLGDGIKDSCLKNKFIVNGEASKNVGLKYFFGLETNNHIINACISSAMLEGCCVNIGEKIDLKDGTVYFINPTLSTLKLKEKNFKPTNSQYFSYLSSANFYMQYNANSDNNTKNDYVYIKIDESDTKAVYITTRLNNGVPYDNASINTVEKQIENGEIKNTISILKNIDNLDSKIKAFGEDINIKETIFYQDLVATIISDEYGLNLKNKDYFYHLDTQYIKYRAFGEDDYMIEITFNYPPYEPYNVDQIKTDYKDNYYFYKDNMNNAYSYYADIDKGKLYVLKNNECVGSITVTHKGKVPKDIFKDLNYIFGTK